MLFNSYTFIFGFFPAVLLTFFLIARYSHAAALGLLVFSSLVFYGWWDVRALPLLLVSIALNFILGRELTARANTGRARQLILAARLKVPEFVLPIGIWFYTFKVFA